ncbi:hypothetical protein [Zamilon virus]|uniref:Uncharacterized protein n=1 Tax=Zamilon virus TaxID=1411887 RepID=V6BPG9_9VIRU|nr:hypothetical protein X812_gp19 [Zamilon virus]CDI70062.1 hypothetical protein [Zamilon virus]
MYCGIGKIPKGKKAGTPEQCLKANQVRMYGRYSVDPKLLENAGKKKLDLTKEILKYKKLQDDAKILIKQYKNLKLIVDDDTMKKSLIKASQVKLKALLVKKDKLVKKMLAQKKIVTKLENEAEKAEKEIEKAKKKSKKKPTKKKRVG